MHPEVICLSDDEDTTNNATAGNNKENVENDIPDIKPTVKTEQPAVKSEPSASIFSQETNPDDEVEVVDASAIQRPVLTTTATTNAEGDDDDDELEVMGATNVQNFVHNRKDCLTCRYVADESSADRKSNAKFCSKCYCYVCDKLASECTDWYLGEKGECVDNDNDAKASGDADGDEKESGDNKDDSEQAEASKADGTSLATASTTAAPATGTASTTAASAELTATTTSASAASTSDNINQQPHKNHCQATDEGPKKNFWRNMRKAIQENKDPSTVSNTSTSRAECEAQMIRQYQENYNPAMQLAMQQAISRSNSSSRRRARSNPLTSFRRRARPRGSTLGAGDHQQRIRAQQMLEELYRS